MKKYLILILFVLLVAVGGCVYYFIGKEKTQNDILVQEINSLSESNVNVDIKTEGDYAKVEKMIKEDYKLYIDSVNKLRENYNTLANLKLINIENFEEDGPEFTKTLEQLYGLKNENIEIISSVEELNDPEKIEERVSANGLDSRFSQMYKDILSQIKLEDGVKQLVETDKKFDSYAQSLIDVFEYMRDNEYEWFIEKGEVKSKSDIFIEQYNKLINKTNIEF